MNLNSTWSVLEESSDSLGGYAYPAMDKAVDGLSLPPDWFTWVAAINMFGSSSFTIAQFMRIFPYGLARVNEESFDSAIQHGYLVADGQGGYRATESGESLGARTFGDANKAIAPLRPMPAESLQKLIDLLARISDAAFAMPEPPVHFILNHKREMHRRLEMTESLAGFVAHCLELEGHRDDSYITTWQAHKVEGHAWDVLDLLSRDETLRFDDLHNKTSRRGVTREVHAEDVMELIRRGWVEERSGVYQITSDGKQVRAEVEAETECLFFSPWACLNESELEELASLASQLREGLKKLDASMNLKSIWSDLVESYNLFNKSLYSVYRKMLEEKTIPPRFAGWGPFVTMFPDEPITFDKYQRIFPYDSEKAFHESLSVAAQEGYLTLEAGAYRATKMGEEATLRGMQGLTDVAASLQPMPQDELKRLVDYLIRLCDTASAAPEPPSHFCHAVYKNYKRTFSNDAPPMRLVIHYYKELDFYRTDAHVAAWQIHNIEGNRWEAFSEVWGGKYNTLDTFYEEYSDRGFTRDEYTQAFQELVERGWVQRVGESYHPTAEGKRIREEAEALTDKYFFAPWSCLSELELEEMSRLAKQLRDGVNSRK